MPRTANPLQRQVIDSADGELMKPQPDMTVQCQMAKSYAGCWAVGRH